MNIDVLFKSLRSTLVDGVYVFATVSDELDSSNINTRMIFKEKEGTTLILLKEEAENAKIPYEFPCRMITLNVHSSLEAIGFIAKIASKLAEEGMGVNPVSGFYHDHLFVPLGRENDALEILKSLTGD